MNTNLEGLAREIAYSAADDALGFISKYDSNFEDAYDLLVPELQIDLRDRIAREITAGIFGLLREAQL